MQNFKSQQDAITSSGFIITNRKLIDRGGIVYSATYGHLLGLQIYFSKEKKVDSEGFFYQSYKLLEGQLKIGEKTLRKYLKQLEKDGLLKIKRVKGMPACYYKVTDGIFDILQNTKDPMQLPEKNTASNVENTLPTGINSVDDGNFSSDPTELFPGDYTKNLPPNNTSVNDTTLDKNINDTLINNSSSLPEYILKVIHDNRGELEKNNINLKALVRVIEKSNKKLSLFRINALIDHLITYAEPIRKTGIFVNSALDNIETIEEKYKVKLFKGDISNPPTKSAPPPNFENNFYDWLAIRE